MIVYNEKQMLSLLLARYCTAFAGFIAIDTGSIDDSVEILKNHGASVKSIAYTSTGDAYRALTKEAEKQNFDYLFVVDADECLMVDKLKNFLGLLDDNCYAFPTLEFMRDKNHINSTVYPDFHTRCFPLNVGYAFRGTFHSVVGYKDEIDNALANGRAIKIPWLPVFHYGKLKSPADIALHYENFDRTRQGLERLSTPTPGYKETYTNGTVVPYYGESPL